MFCSYMCCGAREPRDHQSQVKAREQSRRRLIPSSGDQPDFQLQFYSIGGLSQTSATGASSWPRGGSASAEAEAVGRSWGRRALLSAPLWSGWSCYSLCFPGSKTRQLCSEEHRPAGLPQVAPGAPQWAVCSLIRAGDGSRPARALKTNEKSQNVGAWVLLGHEYFGVSKFRVVLKL